MLKALDPEAWAVIVLLIISIAFGILWRIDKTALNTCKAEFSAFEANTQAAGQLADSKRVETENLLAQAAINIQGDLNVANQERDNTYAAYLKLLNNKTRSSSSKAIAHSNTAVRLACPDSTAEFNSAMAGFENEVVREILKTRDEAISRNIACKAYLEQIISIAGDK